MGIDLHTIISSFILWFSCGRIMHHQWTSCQSRRTSESQLKIYFRYLQVESHMRA